MIAVPVLLTAFVFLCIFVRRHLQNPFILVNVTTSGFQVYRADTALIFHLWFQQVQLQYANLLKHNLLMVHFKALL